MKQVFNLKEVPHIWAQQSQAEGRNVQGNLYFKGATIFSYGSHFPIATMEDNIVLFTTQTYSNTTAKHIRNVRSAVSHKNIIFCYDVPVKSSYDKRPLNKQSFVSEHENNFNHWKQNIQRMFNELGNKKNRDIQSRISAIHSNVTQLNTYCNYFSLKIKDAELKNMLAIVTAPDFIEQARDAKAKQDSANEKKMKQAVKAYDVYIDLWRKYDDEGLQNLPAKTKELCRYYSSNVESFTRLRVNTELNRLETSKGVQIPAEAAKRAYVALNGCMEGSCKDLSIPVMNYTITETGKDYIKAGCHTIPKEDVKYIAQILGW